MSWRELLDKAWFIPAVCMLVVVLSTTFDVVWLLHHQQTVRVEIVVPGYKQVTP